ncbi:non-canonical purine NTP phosphatase [Rheinheimera sediminis]|uniref:inosine/xanthosine triphosphatase n=1 Tax=Rheinheimera sp. YQF-1 TaxID=2499626 RepID=UPI000FD7B5AB|nr:inosine/xanthosine triphosphatase [Rheinheimera sp. YQF-1]RVT44970.1 non-canonical purine NTP phosphatase [Rheinheimera sp. YQF-1]
MIKIRVASANPAKINAVASAFAEVFNHEALDVQGIAVPSGVADQPMSSEETLLGAMNRVAALVNEDADYRVAIEAGLDGDFTFAWMVIEHQGKIGKARSASLMLPPVALAELKQGKELGDVMDALFDQTNVKQKGGAIALLTQNKLSRSSVYHQALILAMIPFLNPAIF